ncbi:MAG: pentapeptide repeat-containing protein [Thaumarchaeota archaeon]|nr:pentapeptide repeat-containing protein [Nitrososphaerota archaeon]
MSGYTKFECPNRAIVGATKCIFHDSNYWRQYSNAISSEFAEQLQKAVKEKQPLYAIGYNLTAINIKGEFHAPVYLTSALFHSGADLNARFLSVFDLSGAVFENGASFAGSVFQDASGFYGVTFQYAIFNWVKFYKYAGFTGTKFPGDARFNATIFLGQSSFNGARFSNVADFHRAVFAKHADFAWTRFDDVAYFAEAKFISANFFRSQIQQANFTDTTLVIPYNKEQKSDDEKDEPKGIVSFHLANFAQPSKAIFDKVNLSRTSFHRTENLDQIQFLNVDWMRAQGNQGSITGRTHIIEERALTEQIAADPVTGSNVTREDVLSVYRRLRDNYEKAARYDDAGRFFVSEMEVQRIFDKKGVKRPWIVRNILSLLALYKIFALYGESYTRPLIWSTILVTGFFFLRFLMSYCTEPTCNDADLIIDSLSAFFQLPRGDHYIDIIERILSAPILGTLFIALKRKFERKIRR